MKVVTLPEAIEVTFETEGVDEVNSSFAEVAANSRRMSESVKADSESMGKSFRSVATDLTILTTANNSVLRLAETFGLLTKEQAEAMRTANAMIGATAGVLKIVQLTTAALYSETIAHYANAIAKWAEAHATAVLATLSGVGIGLVAAAIVAGAAVSAEGARSISGVHAPHLAEGGIIEHPTYALIGERGPEAVVPLNRFSSPTINIYYPTFRSRSDMDYLVDRLKRMGMA
jgi:hypothetical protein